MAQREVAELGLRDEVEAAALDLARFSGPLSGKAGSHVGSGSTVVSGLQAYLGLRVWMLCLLLCLYDCQVGKAQHNGQVSYWMQTS